jgi:hypothetical protein
VARNLSPVATPPRPAGACCPRSRS